MPYGQQPSDHSLKKSKMLVGVIFLPLNAGLFLSQIPFPDIQDRWLPSQHMQFVEMYHHQVEANESPT